MFLTFSDFDHFDRFFEVKVEKNILGDEVDELDQAIAAFMGTSGDRFLQESPLMARKFRNMKILVLWLQEAKKFGRYCYYGCYCLPEGSHNIAMGGYGKPVDNIDRACFNFKQCYKCLLDEHADGQGLPKNTPKSPDCKYLFSRKSGPTEWYDSNVFLR